MAALAACPCCAVVHLDQVTPVDTFFCERGVLELMVEWREKEGNAKKPHGAMFPCGRSDVTRVGGSACREEGGCSTEEEQCLIYTVTAPFYHAMEGEEKCTSSQARLIVPATADLPGLRISLVFLLRFCSLFQLGQPQRPLASPRATVATRASPPAPPEVEEGGGAAQPSSTEGRPAPPAPTRSLGWRRGAAPRPTAPPQTR